MASENNSEQIITLQDFIEEQDERIEEAVRVLGNADDKNCSYSKGYMKRQPLYSCLTCAGNLSTGDAGLCLACSLHCHDGHEFVELYTKRNFRCDCGNSKFGSSFVCLLQSAKDSTNDLNCYDQNFRGAYCTCHRPFPDPDNLDDDDSMIQCIICEDWFHTEHANIEESIESEELACPQCSNKLLFLRCYSIQQPVDQEPNAETKETICTKPKLSEKYDPDTPTYFADGWRRTLCTCKECLDDYKRLNCLYLLDENDSCVAYEREALATDAARRHERTVGARSNAGNSSGGESSQSSSGDGDDLLASLNGMDRIQQLEMIHGFNHMTSELGGFLKKFATDGKVVTQKDIYDFFDELRSKKRRKMDTGDFI